MSIKEKAQAVLGGATAERLSGGRPGAFKAAASAAVAGGVTSVVVFRLLRHAAED
jgi:hypothetical protein